MALAGLLGAASPAGADCDSVQHHRFDFWIGHWEVRNTEGEVVGHNHIERILGGCALRETWKGGAGYHGQSLNTWDASSGKWRQFWTDNHDLTLHLKGNWQNDRMILQGPRKDRDGRSIIDRISWIPLEDGIVRQHWEQSVDGSDFKTVFDGRYVPNERSDRSD